MPKTPYIGINEKARRGRKMYIGVDGIARKVKRGYVGVNGIARLFFTSEFFLPKGVEKENCIAAYQFKGVKTLQEALIDRSEHGYNLTTQGTIDWDPNNGLRSGTVVNSALAQVNGSGTILTYAIFYGNYTTHPDRWGAVLLSNMNHPSLSLYNYYAYGEHGGGSGYTEDGYGHIGIITSRENGDEQAGHWEGGGGIIANIDAPASGVFAGSRTKLYLNGSPLTVSEFGGTSWGTLDIPWGNGTNPVVASENNVDIYAAAFFNIELSDDQHAELARSMSEIKL